MPYCSETGCYNMATQVVTTKGSNRFRCNDCFISEEKKKSDHKKMTVEFCIWLQDTQVFEMFANHLNKGLKLESLDVNKPKVKAKGAV